MYTATQETSSVMECVIRDKRALRSAHPSRAAMKIQEPVRNLQPFCKIFEVMSFLDRLKDLSPEEIHDTAMGLCELPANPESSLSMEEVVFWAGLSTGLELARHAQDGTLDDEALERIEAFSGLLAYSTKNAVVDLTLERLEPSR
jgi:hypothetical protein